MEDLESYYQTSFCFVAFLFSSSFSSSFSLPAAVRPRLYPVILPSSSLPVLTELSFSLSTPSSKQMKVSCHFSYQEAFQHPAVRLAEVAKFRATPTIPMRLQLTVPGTDYVMMSITAAPQKLQAVAPAVQFLSLPLT